MELVLTLTSRRRERKDDIGSVCVWRRSHGSEVSGRIEGIGGIGGIGRDRRDRKGSEGSLPIVRDRKRSEGSEKFKNVRGFGYNRKLGNWKFEIEN